MDLTTQPPVIVRLARPDDIVELAEMGSHTFTVTYGHTVEPDQLVKFLKNNYSPEAITAELANPSKDMIIATNGEAGNIMGFALLTRGTSEPCIEHLQHIIELQRLYVHPDFQKKGVGKLLVARSESIARQERFSYIWLGVWENAHKAITVYERLGYKRVGEHDFKIGNIVHKDHVMVKELLVENGNLGSET
jgi:ribosomal protein S18 acetylase RimI-like enzyme